MTEMESHLLTLLNQRVLLPAEKRDEKVAQRVIDALRAPLAVLDGALQGKHYLLGNSFTIADLNVASVLSWAIPAKLDMSATPAAQAWLQKCLSRDANKKARGLP
jgi:glutathione S-transferase